MTDLKVLAVVSARAGSKGVPGKNLRPLGGRPLLSHVLTTLRQARRVGRVVVSTEDDAIAAVAREYGAETPFVRPSELAEDLVPLVAVTKHAMEQMDRLGYPADVVVQVSPTCPFLTSTTIDKTVALVAEGADSAVTLRRIEHEHPYRAKVLDADGRFGPFLTDIDVERYQSRQELPELYCTSGAVYARRRELLDRATGRDFAFGRVSRGVVVDEIESVNIDRPIDFRFAEFLVADAAARAGA